MRCFFVVYGATLEGRIRGGSREEHRCTMLVFLLTQRCDDALAIANLHLCPPKRDFYARINA